MALPKTAIVVHTIGQELARQGRLPAAVAHYREALARLPQDHPQVASVLTALAQLSLSMGEPTEALTQLQEAMQRKRAAISPSHPFIAFTWLEVGAALFARGRQGEAEEAYRHALAVLERRLGPLHPRTIACHLALARLAALAGRGDDARAHAERVLQSAAHGLGDAREIGLAHAVVGQVAYQEGRIDDAIAAMLEAEAELVPALGEAHADVLALLHDLGRAHLRRSDADAALAVFERALAGYAASVGIESAEAATILNAIGQAHYNRGKFKAALDAYHQSLQIRQRLLGATHPQTLTAQFNCGTAMRQLGDPFGLAEMEGAAETLERTLGAGHPHVQALKAWLR